LAQRQPGDRPPSLEGVLDDVRDALVVLDHDFRCVYLNRSARQILRLDPQDIVGRDVWTLFPDVVGTEIYDTYQRAMREQAATVARRPDRARALVRDVRDALAGSGLAPHRLTLEITETVLMEDMRQGEAVVLRLRELGVQLEIDDFGVGYSSLSYLHRLPVQGLKIDRSFVSGLPGSVASARILEAVVGLAAAFDVRVIAEGVETAEQLEVVRSAGCHAVQGYALARPGPGEELVERLRAAERIAALSAGR
jgi:predicted signal transduction protein with EAL and GGDEF domain